LRIPASRIDVSKTAIASAVDAQMVADAAAHTTQGRLLLVLQENS
jgi:hypothetical protein